MMGNLRTVRIKAAVPIAGSFAVEETEMQKIKPSQRLNRTEFMNKGNNSKSRAESLTRLQSEYISSKSFY